MHRSHAYLATDGGNLTLGHDVKGDNIRQTSTFHIFHDHPQVASDEKTIHKVDNVPMFALLHHDNLVDDQILLGLLLQIHLLDSHASVRPDLVRRKDATRRALTDLVEVSVSLGGIGIRADGIEARHDVGSVALTRSLSWTRGRADPRLLRWMWNGIRIRSRYVALRRRLGRPFLAPLSRRCSVGIGACRRRVQWWWDGIIDLRRDGRLGVGQR